MHIKLVDNFKSYIFSLHENKGLNYNLGADVSFSDLTKLSMSHDNFEDLKN